MEAVRENIPRITELVDTVLEQAGCSVTAQMAIDIALDEILANICHYAYAPGTGTVEVCVDHDEENRTAEITFRDRGVPFDPLQKEDPDTTLTAEQREANLAGAFRPKEPIAFPVLIIDDVRTTGTTLRRCAAALREGGAEQMFALTATAR